MPVLTYGSETMIWREKERSRIKAVQMDNLRGLMGIRRMDKVPNPRIRQLCRVTKSGDEKVNEGALRWFGHVKRMDNRIAKRVYIRECAGSRSVCRKRKRWIVTVNDCLKKRDVRQARRMVHGRTERRGFVSGIQRWLHRG